MLAGMVCAGPLANGLWSDFDLAWLAGPWSFLLWLVLSGWLWLVFGLGCFSCHHGLAEQSVDALVPSTDVAGAVRLDSLRHRCASPMGFPPA